MPEKDSFYATKLMKLLEDFNMVQYVNFPTHKDGGTLDLVISDITDSLKFSHPSGSDSGTESDHFSVSINIECSVEHRPSTKTISYRRYNDLDADILAEEIRSSILCTDLVYPSLDDAVKLYNEIVTAAIDKLCPVVTKKVNVNRSSPWYDLELRELKRKRRRAERAWRKHKHKEAKLIYCKFRDDYNDMIKGKRSSYYKKHISSLKGNSKELYKSVNKLIGKATTASLPACADLNTLRNDFKDYFTNKIELCRQQTRNHTSSNDIHDEQYDTTDTSNTNPRIATFSVFEKVNENDIIDLVTSMNNSTCHLDPLPTIFLKASLKELLPVLTYIVNESLQSGQFPSVLKHALIKPTLKKYNLDPDALKKYNLDPDALKNYRPVSNLTFLSKLIEKAALKQLNVHLDYHGLYNSYQSAYRSNHSCETAMVKIMDDMYEHIAKDESIVLLLLDLSSAFDTIDHSILLEKLSTSYGIKGDVHKWISSYLSERSFEVFVEGKGSTKGWLIYGVPQGSLLGPLLFILYTKDITAIALKHGLSIHIYADDTQLYIAFKPIENLNSLKTQISNCLKEIKSWMSRNFLQVNESKTELLLIGNIIHESSLHENFCIDFDGTDVYCSEEGFVKSLGINLDVGLTLENHITDVCKQCFSQLKNLGRTGRYLNSEIKLMLIKTLILSKVDYCNAIYANISTRLIKKLQSIINACIRFVYCLKRREHITPFLKKAHVLPIKFRVVFKICLLVHKCIFATAPNYLQDLVSQYWPGNESLRSTSDIYKLTLPNISKSQISQKRFNYNAAVNWNSLPQPLRMCNNTELFKTNLKTHLFTRAFQPSDQT